MAEDNTKPTQPNGQPRTIPMESNKNNIHARHLTVAADALIKANEERRLAIESGDERAIQQAGKKVKAASETIKQLNEASDRGNAQGHTAQKPSVSLRDLPDTPASDIPDFDKLTKHLPARTTTTIPLRINIPEPLPTTDTAGIIQSVMHEVDHTLAGSPQGQQPKSFTNIIPEAPPANPPATFNVDEMIAKAPAAATPAAAPAAAPATPPQAAAPVAAPPPPAAAPTAQPQTMKDFGLPTPVHSEKFRDFVRALDKNESWPPKPSQGFLQSMWDKLQGKNSTAQATILIDGEHIPAAEIMDADTRRAANKLRGAYKDQKAAVERSIKFNDPSSIRRGISSRAEDERFKAHQDSAEATRRVTHLEQRFVDLFTERLNKRLPPIIAAAPATQIETPARTTTPDIATETPKPNAPHIHHGERAAASFAIKPATEKKRAAQSTLVEETTKALNRITPTPAFSAAHAEEIRKRHDKPTAVEQKPVILGTAKPGATVQSQIHPVGAPAIPKPVSVEPYLRPQPDTPLNPQQTEVLERIQKGTAIDFDGLDKTRGRSMKQFGEVQNRLHDVPPLPAARPNAITIEASRLAGVIALPAPTPITTVDIDLSEKPLHPAFQAGRDFAEARRKGDVSLEIDALNRITEATTTRPNNLGDFDRGKMPPPPATAPTPLTPEAQRVAAALNAMASNPTPDPTKAIEILNEIDTAPRTTPAAQTPDQMSPGVREKILKIATDPLQRQLEEARALGDGNKVFEVASRIVELESLNPTATSQTAAAAPQQPSPTRLQVHGAKVAGVARDITATTGNLLTNSLDGLSLGQQRLAAGGNALAVGYGLYGIGQMATGDHKGASKTLTSLDAGLIAGAAGGSAGITYASLEANRMAGVLQQATTQVTGLVGMLQRGRAAAANSLASLSRSLPGPAGKFAAFFAAGAAGTMGVEHLMDDKPATPRPIDPNAAYSAAGIPAAITDPKILASATPQKPVPYQEIALPTVDLINPRAVKKAEAPAAPAAQPAPVIPVTPATATAPSAPPPPSTNEKLEAARKRVDDGPKTTHEFSLKEGASLTREANSKSLTWAREKVKALLPNASHQTVLGILSITMANTAEPETGNINRVKPGQKITLSDGLIEEMVDRLKRNKKIDSKQRLTGIDDSGELAQILAPAATPGQQPATKEIKK